MENEDANWIEVSGETLTIAEKLAEHYEMSVEEVVRMAVREYTNRLIAAGHLPPLPA